MSVPRPWIHMWGVQKYPHSFFTPELEWVEWATPAGLPPTKEPRYLLPQKSVWSAQPVWTWRTENSFFPAGIWNADRPTRSPVSVPTTLYLWCRNFISSRFCIQANLRYLSQCSDWLRLDHRSLCLWLSSQHKQQSSNIFTGTHGVVFQGTWKLKQHYCENGNLRAFFFFLIFPSVWNNIHVSSVNSSFLIIQSSENRCRFFLYLLLVYHQSYYRL